MRRYGKYTVEQLEHAACGMFDPRLLKASAGGYLVGRKGSGMLYVAESLGPDSCTASLPGEPPETWPLAETYDPYDLRRLCILAIFGASDPHRPNANDRALAAIRRL